MKLNAVLIAIFLILVSNMLFSCRSEPVIPADPEISFGAQIKPLLAGKCSASGCHGINNPRFALVTYDNVSAYIVPKDVHASKLYDAITRFSGDTRMPPKPAPQLDNEQLKIIYLWIMQGAKNN